MALPRHALVLTAGLGTRLRPLTSVRAKPAIPVGGVPIVRRIVGWLAGNGVTDIVLNLHHRPETITAVVGDGSDLSARVRYSWEQPLVLGAAGGPRLALPIVGADTFFLVNGDTLTDVDLVAISQAHDDRGAVVTLALVPNREPERYGGVRLDAAERVTGFVPRGAAAKGSYHFIGVQLVCAEAFRSIPAGQPAHSIGGVYDALIASRPGSIGGLVTEAAFFDIGTVKDYWTTSRKLGGADVRQPASSRQTVRIDPTARVSDSILWDDIDVSAGAVVEECIITDGVSVPAGATVRRVILVRGDHGMETFPLDI
jgi:NDP-sugar pyrophosphorylase family protein